MSLAASSTDISRRIMSFLGTNNIKPDVGFGVVGKKTVTRGPMFIFFFISPNVSVEIKATAHTPFFGYSTKHGCLKLVPLGLKTAWIICFIELYIVLTTGVRERIFSPKEIACLPKKPDAIDPIRVVVIKNKKTPRPGIYISNRSKGLYLGGIIGITLNLQMKNYL